MRRDRNRFDLPLSDEQARSLAFYARAFIEGRL